MKTKLHFLSLSLAAALAAATFQVFAQQDDTLARLRQQREQELQQSDSQPTNTTPSLDSTNSSERVTNATSTPLPAPPAGGSPPAGPGMRGQPNFDMIARQLNLTDDQKRKFRSIMESRMQKMRDLRQDSGFAKLSPEDRAAEVKAALAETEAQMKALLTPKQFEKWQKMPQTGMRRDRMGPSSGNTMPSLDNTKASERVANAANSGSDGEDNSMETTFMEGEHIVEKGRVFMDTRHTSEPVEGHYGAYLAFRGKAGGTVVGVSSLHLSAILPPDLLSASNNVEPEMSENIAAVIEPIGTNGAGFRATAGSNGMLVVMEISPDSGKLSGINLGKGLKSDILTFGRSVLFRKGEISMVRKENGASVGTDIFEFTENARISPVKGGNTMLFKGIVHRFEPSKTEADLHAGGSTNTPPSTPPADARPTK